ncbi:pilus assembly FimT family protein [Roseateles sp. P5_E7]
MQRLLFRKFRSGVTLIEMLIGVAVVGVVLAVAIPSLTSTIERRRVVAAAGEIASFFAQARAESAVVADKISVHLEDVPAKVGDFSCIRMSSHAQIDVCRCNRVDTKVCSIGEGRLLREYLLPRNTSVRFDVNEKAKWGFDPQVLTFERGSFPTDVSDVFVKVKGVRTGALLHVEYNQAGRVRTCSPDGSIGGFPLCG